MTQERRRYGFVLERQCSLAKHYLAYHSVGHTLFQGHLDNWHDVAKSREQLPSSVENMFANKLSVSWKKPDKSYRGILKSRKKITKYLFQNISFWNDNNIDGDSPRHGMDDDRLSVGCQLRKTKSVDASCLDMRAMGDMNSSHMASPSRPLTRAKSDFNLNSSTSSLIHGKAALRLI